MIARPEKSSARRRLNGIIRGKLCRLYTSQGLEFLLVWARGAGL